MLMLSIKGLVVTSVNSPSVVRSRKGDNMEMVSRQSYGLSLCLSGQITYTMNGKNYVSTQANAILLPKGGCYTLSRDTEGLFPLVNFECVHADLSEIRVIPLRDPHACILLFERLQQLFLRNESRLKILSTFYDLLATVDEENVALAESTSVPLLVHNAMRFMEEKIEDPELSNSMIAEHLNISEVYLRKLFHAHCHTTPRQHLIARRIDLAMYMLVHTSWNVTAIAQKCGFSSQYTFCRTFKQHAGLTPTQYASQNAVRNI